MKKSLEKIKEIQIDKNESILFALKKMDELGVKLLIVIDNEKFYSLLSIGDIQRAIINNTSLDYHIHKILRKNIDVAMVGEDFNDIKKRMFAARVECMPVLDKDGNLVKAYFWEDLFADKIDERTLNLPVVIMAGGRGTRLKPITNIIPKPLIPIGERPIIEIIMNDFHKLGICRFFVTANYKYEMIKYYFENLEKLSYEIEYIVEEKPLGTAGSLSLLKEKITTTFFVSNCDILINQDFRDIYDFHVENKNEITKYEYS